MVNFKKVLEVEKKYEHIISSAKQGYEKKIAEVEEEMRIKEEAYISDYIYELDRDFNREIKIQKNLGDEMIKKAEAEKELMINTASKDDAIEFLVEEFKNVQA